MDNIIKEFKYVELIYKVIDKKTGNIFLSIEYPVGYVHGINDTLGKEVINKLEGKRQGDVIEVEIDVDKLYGIRDESLVFIDKIENIPQKYQKVGTKIVMENSKGEAKDFLVTKVDDKTVTIDGNNPLCGREVKFILDIHLVRDATDGEMEVGGMTDEQPDIEQLLSVN